MIRKNPQGIYTVIALMIISIFLLILPLMAATGTESLRRAGADLDSKQAKLHAEGALAMALAKLNGSSGFPLNGVEQNASGEKLWEWRIVGASNSGKIAPKLKLGKNKEYFSYPAPGGGSAGTDCDTVHPPANDADHPCNWHRFTYGDPPIEIPLWGLAKEDDETYKAANLTLTDFQLRVRTPCKNDASGIGICKAGERFALATTEPPDFDSDEVKQNVYLYMKKWHEAILKDSPFYWAISGECSGNPCAISEITDLTQFLNDANEEITTKENTGESFSKEQIAKKYIPPMITSAITAENINKYLTDFASAALANSTSGLGDYNPTDITTLGEFFAQSPPNEPKKTFLRLAMVKPLIEKGGNSSVPYLEYQILYKTKDNTPIIGNPTIIAEGYSGGFKKTLEFHATQHPPTSGLVFEPL